MRSPPSSASSSTHAHASARSYPRQLLLYKTQAAFFSSSSQPFQSSQLHSQPPLSFPATPTAPAAPDIFAVSFPATPTALAAPDIPAISFPATPTAPPTSPKPLQPLPILLAVSQQLPKPRPAASTANPSSRQSRQPPLSSPAATNPPSNRPTASQQSPSPSSHLAANPQASASLSQPSTAAANFPSASPAAANSSHSLSTAGQQPSSSWIASTSHRQPLQPPVQPHLTTRQPQLGMGIYDAMKLCKADVSTVCLGLAASMGAFLLASGTKGKRFCMPNARVMIHQPLGTAGGKTTEMSLRIREMMYHKVKLNKILSRITGKHEQQIEADTDRDNFMSPWEAKGYGLVDSIIDDGKEGLVAPISDEIPPPKTRVWDMWKIEGKKAKKRLPSELNLSQ